MTDDALLNVGLPAAATSPLDSQIERLERLGRTEGLTPEQRRENVLEAAREFEAVLMQQLLHVMRESMLDDKGAFGEGDGMHADMYTQLFEGEVARQITAGGTSLGISDLVYKQLAEGVNKADPHATPAAPPVPTIPASPDALKTERHRGPDPLQGAITSSYGMRTDPFTRRLAYHRGIDLRAAEGTPVRPVLAGVVQFAGRHGGYGNLVTVRHDDGTVTKYGHLKDIYVKEGDVIDKNCIIGTVGSTGRSTGPHLHFEVLADGERPINPGTFLETHV